jgi:hypothetical protein
LGFGPLLRWAGAIFGVRVRTKMHFGPLFVGFGPLLKMKPGQRKPSVYAGLRAFGPLSHIFFYLNTIKKLINIYK